MDKLLNVDLYRLKKDKTALIGVIISAGLLVFTIGLSLIMKILGTVTATGGLDALFTPKSTYIQGFQMGSNAGLVVIIILTVITTREFTQNTIRLKIINGFDRRKIYFSALFTNLIYGITVIFGYSLLSLLGTSAIFGYGSEFNYQELVDLTLVTFMALIYVAVYVSLVTAVGMRMQRIGATIGISIGVILGETIIYSFVVMLPILAGKIPIWVMKVLHILPSVGMGSLVMFNYNAELIVIMLVSSIVLIIGINLLAMYSFTKVDIK
ncbi:MAG: hypothetical protein ACOX56_06765 [Acholeplasmataceae bacterium]|jgi:ABC-type transport system involved in multi-copper enzyme maturation permease subunit